MDIITKSDPHQEDPTLPNVSLLQELDSPSLGTTLPIQNGYYANYEQWVKRFNSFQTSDLLSDSTDRQCNKYFGVNNEESDQCQICSDCDHVKLQTHRNANKRTQEHSCKVLNPNPFNSADCATKTSGDDAWSEQLTANVDDTRIHKSSRFGQDTLGPPIGLNEYSKEVNKTDQVEPVRSKELHCEEPCNMIVSQQNSQRLKSSDQQKHVYDKKRNFHYTFDDQKSALKMPKSIDPECFHPQNAITSCCHTVSEWSYNVTYPHSMDLYSDQFMSESTHPTISKNTVQEMLHITDGITPSEWPNSSHSYGEQVRQKNAFVCSSGGQNKCDKITSECYKNREKTKYSSSGSREGNDAEIFSFYLGKHLAVLLYILSAAVTVLAFTVMHLYLKIQSLEASRDVFNTNYQGGEKQPVFLDKQLLETIFTRETNEKLTALLSSSKFFMLNTEQRTYKHSDDNNDTLDANVQHPKGNKQSSKSTSHEIMITNTMPAMKEMEITSATSTTSRDSSTPEVTPVSEISSAGANRFESVDVGAHSGMPSRVVRSAQGNQQGFNDRKKWVGLRKGFCGGSKNSCKMQIDSFEGIFSRVINFRQKLTSSECSSHEEWEPDIKACRGNTILFPRQYSVLPFYLETTGTADKKEKKRLVTTDSKGRFNIQKPGQYLIHVNIIVVDPKGTQFLAVYLNNETVLACPSGGVRRSNSNHAVSVKYRVCNIIGLLECHTNDTVDIRTMDSNMTVHLEDTHKSHFNFVLLN